MPTPVDTFPHIPMGIPELDEMIGEGCPGIPMGRITHFYGDHTTGKTTLLIAIAAEAQRRGLGVYYCQPQNCIPNQRFEQYGIDLDIDAGFARVSGQGLRRNFTQARGADDVILIDDFDQYLRPNDIIPESYTTGGPTLVLASTSRASLAGYGPETAGPRAVAHMSSLRIRLSAGNSAKVVKNSMAATQGSFCTFTVPTMRLPPRGQVRKTIYDFINEDWADP